MIKLTGLQNKTGVHMTFKNGVTISIQFGPHTYSDNRNKSYADYIDSSTTFEVAMWTSDGNWIEIDKQSLFERVTTDDLVTLINYAANYQSEESGSS